MDYGDIIEDLKNIARSEDDHTLNIPSFLERIMATIESSGKDFASKCYDLPMYLVNEIATYMERV